MERSPALLVAHPGHELRLHRWLELARPSAYVLTDGSGSAGHSRVPSTQAVLEKAGARAGSIVAPFTDVEIYNAILQRDLRKITDVTLRLADAFVDAEFVVCDAWESYNPTHDVCRIAGELATERASRLAGRAIAFYEYPVVGTFEESGDEHEIVIHLDDDAADRKIAAAYAYSELRGDVDEMLRSAGVEQLRLEVLRRATPIQTVGKPFYETRGEQQVAAGRYDTVLRYRDHLQPFVEALAAAVRGAVPAWS